MSARNPPIIPIKSNILLDLVFKSLYYTEIDYNLVRTCQRYSGFSRTRVLVGQILLDFSSGTIWHTQSYHRPMQPSIPKDILHIGLSAAQLALGPSEFEFGPLLLKIYWDSFDLNSSSVSFPCRAFLS